MQYQWFIDWNRKTFDDLPPRHILDLRFANGHSYWETWCQKSITHLREHLPVDKANDWVLGFVQVLSSGLQALKRFRKTSLQTVLFWKLDGFAFCLRLANLAVSPSSASYRFKSIANFAEVDLSKTTGVLILTHGEKKLLLWTPTVKFP